ncbi:hypothetical protein M2324_001953 [Rhodovulum sulfidophilum]|nr:hypothetical protein A6W98_16425 [Rhodovulum sulfidophilum DSM 1374]ANB39333.1 hypothetical protein A6024_16280 [Rhodovulum sulfidophilum]MCW2303556.1 hypothetical protein [Rhodovulum sulfidophilum]
MRAKTPLSLHRFQRLTLTIKLDQPMGPTHPTAPAKTKLAGELLSGAHRLQPPIFCEFLLCGVDGFLIRCGHGASPS